MSQITIQRDDLTTYLNTLLHIEQFKDYSPNGLQVEGKSNISKIAFGVTASLALIKKALAMQADAIVVHHGLFWQGQDGRVVGWMKQRLQQLLTHDVSLYGYHLPLDAHPTFGNNAMIGQNLGLKVLTYTGEQGILAIGEPADGSEITLATLVQKAKKVFNKDPVVVLGDGRMLRKIGWCSGGAQSYFEDAIAAGVDAYITGEISEPQTHYAREMGIAYMASGHHATERFGIHALAAEVNKQFGVICEYIEIDNPA